MQTIRNLITRDGIPTRFCSRAYASQQANRRLSRTQRRLLERKERNRTKRASRTVLADQSLNGSFKSRFRWMLARDEIYSFLSKSERLKNCFESLVPKVPGRNVSFTHHSLFVALGLRLPFFLALSYAITNENTSPYVIRCSLGPSMLPTIQFMGDIWLVETGAWRQMFQRFDKENLPTLRSLYKVGDLIIWEDSKTGKRSCKRVIGLEGDRVHRLGEYRKLYRNRADCGILWPKSMDEANNQMSDANCDQISEKDDMNENAGARLENADTIVVPNQCVWLEGDCPLFSMDSRQYGPIHSSKIRGRLIFRLWPWKRHDLTNDKENSYLSSCWISNKRPVPYSSIDAYLGSRFELYRVASLSDTQPQVER